MAVGVSRHFDVDEGPRESELGRDCGDIESGCEEDAESTSSERIEGRV